FAGDLAAGRLHCPQGCGHGFVSAAFDWSTPCTILTVHTIVGEASNDWSPDRPRQMYSWNGSWLALDPHLQEWRPRRDHRLEQPHRRHLLLLIAWCRTVVFFRRTRNPQRA